MISPFPPPGTQCTAVAMTAAGGAAGVAEESAACTACLGIEVDQIPWAVVPMASAAVAVVRIQ